MFNRLPVFGGLSGPTWSPQLKDVLAESIIKIRLFHKVKAVNGARIRMFC